MATLVSNVIVSRSYTKTDNEFFRMVAHRDITEDVNIMDTYALLKQTLMEIKNIDKQTLSQKNARETFVAGYNNLSTKAGEERETLLEGIKFPTEFKEELLEGVTDKTLANVFAALDNILGNIKSCDDEIKKLEEKRVKKIELYNDVVSVVVDVKREFWGSLEVPASFSEELLEKKEDVATTDAV